MQNLLGFSIHMQRTFGLRRGHAPVLVFRFWAPVSRSEQGFQSQGLKALRRGLLYYRELKFAETTLRSLARQA